jgi:hypothetical protein
MSVRPYRAFEYFSKICRGKFKVCLSPCIIVKFKQINYQPDATIFQFFILTFIYSSTCFGGFPTHQELSDCSGSLWFYLRVVVTVVLCSRSGRPDHEHSIGQFPLQFPPRASPCTITFQLDCNCKEFLNKYSLFTANFFTYSDFSLFLSSLN